MSIDTLLENFVDCWSQYSTQDYNTIEKLYNNDDSKTRHSCEYCGSTSQSKFYEGHCGACGAPFIKQKNKNIINVRGGINNSILYTYAQTQ